MIFQGLLRSCGRRPKLIGATTGGIGVALALSLLPLGLHTSTACIFGWDTACAIYVAWVLHGMHGKSPDDIMARSAEEDEGAVLILSMVVIAAAASLGAIFVEAWLGAPETTWERLGRVLLTIITLSGSWLVAHIAFALHYAHAYYGVADDESQDLYRGLKFPGDDEPDYWDFLHFSLIIGVASQTADIAFTAKGMRRLGTVHGLVAFVFNTVVLALTINMLAGLFQPK